MPFIKLKAAQWAKAFANRKDVDADDLIQCAYFAVVDAVKGYDPARGKGYFTGYLKYHIMKQFQLAYGIRRKEDAANRAISLDAKVNNDPDDERTILDTLESKTDYIYLTEDMIFTKQLHNALMNAIDRLSENEKTVIRGRYFEGMTYNEIGKIKHLSLQRIGHIEREALRKIKKSRQGVHLRSDFLGDCYKGTGYKNWLYTGCSVEESVILKIEQKHEAA